MIHAGRGWPAGRKSARGPYSDFGLAACGLLPAPAALIHLEGMWAEIASPRKAAFHAIADKGAGARAKCAASCPWPCCRRLNLAALPICGIPPRRGGATAYPVEFKRGKPCRTAQTRFNLCPGALSGGNDRKPVRQGSCIMPEPNGGFASFSIRTAQVDRTDGPCARRGVPHPSDAAADGA